MIDEVYTSQRVEYNGGKIYGLENGQITKTVAIMIKSITSPSEDIIALLPVIKISPELQWNILRNSIKGLTEVGFDLVSISFDNHPTNRSIIKNFILKAQTKTFFINPLKCNSSIYAIFDMVHNWKNIRNNF